MASKKRNKQLNIIHYVDGGIFPIMVMFVQGFEYDELIDELKTSGSPDYWIKGVEFKKDYILSIKTAAAFSIEVYNLKDPEQERKLFYIYSKKYLNKSNPHDMVILSHVCLHICQFALPDILDRSKEHEAEVYYHSHLMENIINQL